MAGIPEVVQDRVRGHYQVLGRLLAACPVSFGDEGFHAALPKTGGVYIVESEESLLPTPLYVGQAKDVRQRIYTNHLKGNKCASRLRAALIDSCLCKNEEQVSEFLAQECRVRCICIEDARERKLFEHFALAVLAPKLQS